MDLIFKCPHCEQELEVDDGGAGSTIQCPSCLNNITVPNQPSASPTPGPATTPREEKHYSVPAHDAPAEGLIQKPSRPLEVVSKEGDRTLKIKTFKRSDCQEVGKDRFDEKVSHFLSELGQINVVSISTITYSTVDMQTQRQVDDYGVLVVFKG